MWSEIQAYEKRLLEDRQKLLQLTELSKAEDSEILQDKIKYFRTELAYMNNQLEMLKRKAQAVSATQAIAYTLAKQDGRPDAVVDGQGASVNEALQMQQSTAVATNQQIQKPVNNVVSHQMYQPKQVDVKPKKNTVESTIGKSIMGVMASVLIFISIILFAILAMPYLTNEVKLATLYLVSVAFLGVGMYKLHKDKESDFYVAITGCGVGALYLSLFLSNIYFKVIDDIVLYVLVAAWALFVCYLCRFKRKVFLIIGQLGIVIAVVFGCLLCVSSGDLTKFAALIVFYAVAANVFYFNHFERDFSKNVLNHIFNITNIFFLSMGCFDLISLADQPHMLEIVMMIMVAIHVGIIYYCKWDAKKYDYGFVVTAYVVLFVMLFLSMLVDEAVCGIAMYVTAMVVILLTEIRMKERGAGKSIIQTPMIILAFIGLVSAGEFSRDFLIVLLLVLPLLILGFLREYNVYKYGSVVVFLIYIMLVCDGEPIGFTLMLELITVGIMHALMYLKKEQYSYSFKVWAYICLLSIILGDIGTVLDEAIDDWSVVGVIIFTILVIANIAMRFSCFAKNLNTGEAEAPVLYNIVNAVLMVWGLGKIADGSDGVLHIIVIFVTLAAFMLNVKNILEKDDGMEGGFYVGIKFTVLMVFILNSFEAENYIVSIFCIAFAIASIIVGFMIKKKALRYYGIVLTMISIFKLIMIDISYSNTLGNAVSFFVSGILCFAISMIYNYIDKKLAE